MKRMKHLLAALPFLALACNAFTQPLPFVAAPTATFIPISTTSDVTLDPNCPDPQPSQVYIDSAIAHNAKYFSAPGWKQSYTVMESRVSILWKNDDLGAVATNDHVIFCDATESRLNEYYNAAIFDIIFQNYQGHTLKKECRSDDVRLYEFQVKSGGFDYNAKFWVEAVDEDHIRESLLVFPSGDGANMDLYSNRVMPDLSSCE